MKPVVVVPLVLPLLLGACGDAGGGGQSTTSVTLPPDTTDGTGPVTPTTSASSASASDGTASASMGQTTSDSSSTAPPTSTTTITTVDTGDSSAGSSTSGVIKDDFGGGESSTGEPVPCPRGGGDLDFSYIWISNTSESTLTKLNTVTLIEEGRYLTRADSSGSPSRTSVNLSGDVVVANRSGGVTKFLARGTDCIEQNGMPGIQTSTGKADVKPWDVEECRAWHTPLAGTSNRPVAWTSGIQDPVSCLWEEQKVWTSTSTLGQPGSMKVHRLDGDTGLVEASVDLPGVDIGAWGAYGGAVDGANDFWLSTHGSSAPPSLTRVRFADLTVQTWPAPPGVSTYGMTVDAKGRPWVAGYAGGVARFTPDTETWDVVPTVTGLGMQADGEGRVWVGTNPNSGVTAIDTDSLLVLQVIPIQGSITKGISIDFFGNVWVVSMDTRAFRVDPETLTVDIYDGLNQAYTYSDMTGWGLLNVLPQ
jgi:hypothetical protein